MVNYKELTDQQLTEIIQKARKELDSRKTQQLALYTHNCQGASKHHLRKYKHWSKLVTSVDTSKTNGYAFGGDFLAVVAEHKIPAGSVVVEVCDDSIEAYVVNPEGKELKFRAETRAMSKFIEDVASILR